jgi:hypothetical protein
MRTPRLSIWACLAAFLAAAVPGVERAAADEPGAEPRWLGHLNLQGGGNDDKTAGRVELWVPLAQDSNQILYGSANFYVGSDETFSRSIGLGYRAKISDHWLAGGYGFFDVTRTAFDNTFYQGSFGIEASGTGGAAGGGGSGGGGGYGGASGMGGDGGDATGGDSGLLGVLPSGLILVDDSAGIGLTNSTGSIATWNAVTLSFTGTGMPGGAGGTGGAGGAAGTMGAEGDSAMGATGPEIGASGPHGVDLVDAMDAEIAGNEITTSVSGTGTTDEVGYLLGNSMDISGLANTYAGGGDACRDDGGSSGITLEVNGLPCP